WNCSHLLREAIEKPGAPGGYEVRLAAATAGVRRVPGVRILSAALFVMMAELCAAGSGARPVVACQVARQSFPVETGTGQHVVRVGIVTPAVDGGSFFRK